jgi:hypothetical protein
MGPRNAYKDMLDNEVSPITCVSMNHQNQLEQMVNEAMFATHSYRNTTVARLFTKNGGRSNREGSLSLYSDVLTSGRKKTEADKE